MGFFSSRNWHPSSDMPTTKSSRPCNGTPNHASSQPSSPHLLVSPYYSLSLLTGSHALPSPPTSTSLSLLFSLPLLPPSPFLLSSFFFLLLPIQPFVSSPSSLPPPPSFPSLLCFHQIQVLSFGVMISPTHSTLFSSLPPIQPLSNSTLFLPSHQCNPLLFLPTNSTLFSSLPPIQSSLLSKHSPFIITNTSQTKLSSC